MDLLQCNKLTMDEQMQLPKNRVACGVTDGKGKKYYVIYLGVGAQANSKESAKKILMDELEKRFS